MHLSCARSVFASAVSLLLLLLPLMLLTAVSASRGGRLRALPASLSLPRSAARRAQATAAATNTSTTAITDDTPTPTHPAFRVISDRLVSEYGLRAIEYEHGHSGARVMSVLAPDENKVFGITFRTPPSDSTGLPHVLEHSVLCGSRKYPTKEPFVHLLKGSLNTFLNAFTYPDRTCYPVASMNLKDFYNLVDVYLDAVLYPRAIQDPRVLAQEGWHYSLENETDPLQYKGVVYNEMKGVYSSPDAIMGRATQRALFPDNAYGHDSGGDPADIPNMSFESFNNFHSTYYHPSNSRIFFYGDDDPTQRLQLLDVYLRDFRRIPDSDSSVKFQPRFKESKKEQMAYPTSQEDEKKHMFAINWVLNEAPMQSKDKLGLAVLNHLLFGTPDSVMRKALMESLLGDGIIADYGDELLQSTLEVG
jgi:Zn-dependent M16 (insulinase) family peptidase